jgi:hypothetical protein
VVGLVVEERPVFPSLVPYAGPFYLHNLGSHIGKELAAVGGGYGLPKFHDAQTLEQRKSQRESPEVFMFGAMTTAGSVSALPIGLELYSEKSWSVNDRRCKSKLRIDA